ncbi:hypothetical protein [Salidesulfovibrio onnuriiensis]|uniref:hypothetical protein n=1 Tax=Salidesulfovibrio onnuriiensis TaxID=2583823 RepID=UPI0011CA14DA|nr:hypothetical protein [Salidesulfovibrio onnuriiensis]
MDQSKLGHIEESIRRMTAVVRETSARAVARSFGEDPDAKPLGWWVLACGDPLDPDDFQSRDQARDRLRNKVEECGIMLTEHIWVWDESEAAQLVITTLPTRERAERVAAKLKSKGLAIRVRKEKI